LSSIVCGCLLPTDARAGVGEDGRAALAWYEARRAVAERDALIFSGRGEESRDLVERSVSPGGMGWSVVDLRDAEPMDNTSNNEEVDDWEHCPPVSDQ